MDTSLQVRNVQEITFSLSFRLTVKITCRPHSDKKEAHSSWSSVETSSACAICQLKNSVKSLKCFVLVIKCLRILSSASSSYFSIFWMWPFCAAQDLHCELLPLFFIIHVCNLFIPNTLCWARNFFFSFSSWSGTRRLTSLFVSHQHLLKEVSP